MMTAEKPHGRATFEQLFACDDADASDLAKERLTIDDEGVRLNRFKKHEIRGLTPGEVASLERHPTGRYDDPVLRFPFCLAELLEFERFYGLIAEYRRYQDGERCADRLTGDAIWLLDALLDVVEGKRTENEVIDEEVRRKFSPTHPQTQAGTVEAASVAATVKAWIPTKPKRFQGYTEPLYLLLEAAHIAGDDRPTARDVLQAFAAKQPSQIAKVIVGESLDYYIEKGTTKTANLKAIRETIRGMTGNSQN